MQPVIGITPSPSRDELPHGTFDRFVLSAMYVNAVAAAGGIPFILPPYHSASTALLDRLDGLLLSGGADVDPVHYGDDDLHPTTYGVSELRDGFEFALLDEALRRDLPILCICRGIQVLNVALGGTLHQHIPDHYPTDLAHRQHEVGIPAAEPGHRVDAEPDALLARTYGATSLDVNSFHHQAIKDLAPDLLVDGRAGDGLIEAVSLPGKSFVLGLQWHPEMMFERHPMQLAPFQAHVGACVKASLTAARR